MITVIAFILAALIAVWFLGLMVEMLVWAVGLAGLMVYGLVLIAKRIGRAVS
jgi:hypothetical protein